MPVIAVVFLAAGGGKLKLTPGRPRCLSPGVARERTLGRTCSGSCLYSSGSLQRGDSGEKEALASAVINWSFSPASCGPGRPDGIGHWVGLGALPAAHVLSSAGHRERTLENNGLASASSLAAESMAIGSSCCRSLPIDVQFPPARLGQ